MSVSRRRLVARSRQRSKICALGLVLAACVVFLAPLLALAFVSGDGGCLCQIPQPPGDPLAVVVFLDAAHGWATVSSPSAVTVGYRVESVKTRALHPPGCPFALVSERRPPPLFL